MVRQLPAARAPVANPFRTLAAFFLAALIPLLLAAPTAAQLTGRPIGVPHPVANDGGSVAMWSAR